MNVLMIIPAAFPGSRGSPARVYDMATVLYERGINVSVACYYEGAGKPTKMRVYRIQKLPFYKNGVGPSYSRIILDFFLMLKVFRILITSKIDILHCHLHEGAIIGIITGALFKKAVVFDIHSSLENELLQWKFIRSSGILYKIAAFLDRNIPKWVDYNIVLGEKQVRFYKNINDSTKIRRVSNPTDIDFFKPGMNELRKKLNLESYFVIGYQGNMTKLQNLELLVDSAEVLINKCSNLKFLMGYTSDPDEIIKSVNEKKLEKYFLFIHSPYESTPEIINSCDIMVIPRLETYGLPMKLSNYMACGKPVVLHEELAFGASGEPKKIGLYSFRTKEDFISRILELVKNKHTLSNTTDDTLSYAKAEFSHQSLYKKLNSIYEEISLE